MLAPPQVRIHASSVHLYSLRLEYMFAPVICILSGWNTYMLAQVLCIFSGLNRC